MAVPGCIFLDVGHVIVDIDFRNFAELMRRFTGLETEQLRAAINGGDLAGRYERGMLQDTEFHEEVCRRVGRNIPWDDFVGAWNSIFLPAPLLPESLIVALVRERPVWVASNTNRIHFDFTLRHFPLLRHFTGYVLSYETGFAKPDLAFFRHALLKAGVKAEEALFTDDQVANVEAARSLGIDAFQFLNPNQVLDELHLRGIALEFSFTGKSR